MNAFLASNEIPSSASPLSFPNRMLQSNSHTFVVVFRPRTPKKRGQKSTATQDGTVKATLPGGAAERPVPKAEVVAAAPKPGKKKAMATIATTIGTRNLVRTRASFEDTNNIK